MDRYVKSVVYLVGMGGGSYVLLQLCAALEKINGAKWKDQAPKDSDASRKTQAFMDILKGAAESNEPIYRQSSKEFQATKEKLLAAARS